MGTASMHVSQLKAIVRKPINPSSAPPLGDVIFFQGQLVGWAVGWDESVYITDQRAFLVGRPSKRR